MSATQLVILLFSGIALCELHGFIYHFWPQTANIEYDLFLDKGYHEKVTVLWYIYELMNILNRIIWAYVLVKISKNVSYKLYKVGYVFIGYYFTQFLFYIYDRNTSYLANYCLYTCMALTIFFMISKRKTFDEMKSV